MKLYSTSRYILISGSENTAELYEFTKDYETMEDLRFVLEIDVSKHTVGYKGIISKYGKGYYVINEEEIIRKPNKSFEYYKMF